MPALLESNDQPERSGAANGVHPSPRTGSWGPPLAGWMIAAFLGIIAACLVLRLDEPMVGRALGQSVSHAGARGVFAFTGQLTKTTFGVFMVDVDAGTIWCYEWDEGRGCLRFIAARSWRYDRYLEEFNACDLPPREVERMVEMERAKRLQEMQGVDEE